MSIKAIETLSYLVPEGGWIQRGEHFNDIEWIDGKALCTQEEYEKCLSDFAVLQENIRQETKLVKEHTINKLQELGLNQNDLKVLGLG